MKFHHYLALAALLLYCTVAWAIDITETDVILARPTFECYSAGVKMATCNPTWIIGPGVSSSVFKCRSSNRLGKFEACIDLQ